MMGMLFRKLYPNQRWNFVEINVSFEDYQRERERIIYLMNPSDTVMDLVRENVVVLCRICW